MDYIAYLHRAEGSADYGVSFPDFPGCIAAGKTVEEARRMAVEALALHIQGMVEEGVPVPEPSKLEDLKGDPTEDAIAVLVKGPAGQAGAGQYRCPSKARLRYWRRKPA